MDFLNNNPPSIPALISPADGSENVPHDSVTLSWASTDPDGHALKYHVFVCRIEEGEEAVFYPVATEWTSSTFVLTGLTPDAVYLWKVVASDGQGTTDGSTWSFTTQSAETVATPSFNPDSGAYPGNSVNVTIACDTPDAMIRYTSGSGTTPDADPTTNSPPVPANGIVNVPIPGWLKAKAWKDGMSPSEVTGATYALQVVPIPISSIADLQKIGNDHGYPLDGHYVLTQDIDAAETATWNDGAGFAPIGSSYNASFTGTFDGNGHVIRNLTINRSDADGASGLFGVVVDGEIRNLGLEDGSVTGGTVGELVGVNFGTIGQCYATGAVTGITVGGLVGYNKGTVNRCYATGSVAGLSNLDGSVEGVGGLVGVNFGTIVQCYASGHVVGIEDVGGLVGNGWWKDASDSYWDVETSGQETSAGGEGRTTAQMKDAATFVDWDWGVWGIAADGGSYPYLLWAPPPFRVQVVAAGPGSVTSVPGADGNTLTVTATADGNAEFVRWEGCGIADPSAVTTTVYVDIHKTVRAVFRSARAISSIADLQKIGKDPAYSLNGRYWLTQDIDATETATWNDTGTDTDILEGFQPIGERMAPFTGTFDGNGHVIRNLTINRSGTSSSSGLFGVVVDGEIRKLGLEGCAVTGRISAGRLVDVNYGTIVQCYATGAVTGSSSVGGLVGANYSAIVQCHATGAVTGSYGVGGLVGENNGTIVQCYASGHVVGNEAVGGLAGDGEWGEASDSYWDVDATGQDGSGGGIGRTTAEMKQAATFVDWDWDVWGIDENLTYPYLKVEVATKKLEVRPVVRLAASGSDKAAEIPAGVGTIEVGDIFFIEFWAKNLDGSPKWLTVGGVDVSYNTALVVGETAGLYHGGIYNTLSQGTVDDAAGLVDEFGGGVAVGFEDTELGTSHWARIGWAQFTATAEGTATFTLAEATTIQWFRKDAGGSESIAWGDVTLGTTQVDVVSGPTPDLNGDDVCNLIDYGHFLGCYGKRPGEPGWEPSGPKSDYNRDNVVNLIDYGYFLGFYGTQPPWTMPGTRGAVRANQIEVVALPVSAASATDKALALPTALDSTIVGDGFVVELWVKNVDGSPSWISVGGVDVGYATALVDVGALNHGSTYSNLPQGTVDDGAGLVDEFGGGVAPGTTDAQLGTSHWARLGYFAVSATSEGTVQFTPAQASTAMFFRSDPFGVVDWGNVVFTSGSVAINSDVPAHTVTFQPGAHGSLVGGTPNVEVVVNDGDPVPAGPAVTPVAGWSHTGWDWQPVVRGAAPETITQDWTATATYADVAAPVITVDPTEVTLVAGTANPDVLAGVTATDNADGNLTGSVVVGGQPVDMGVPGDYVVTYTVSDAAGNPAMQATRTYHVVDNWLVELTLDTGDFPALSFGADAAATDGYDDGVDDLLPGEGPSVTRTVNNFAGLYRPKGAETFPSYFRRDIRKLGEDYYWVLEMEAFEESITASWNPTSLPVGVDLRIVACDRDGNAVVRDAEGTPMREMDHVTVTLADGVKYYRIHNAGAEVSFDLDLVDGWNLVSIPIAPVNPAVEVVFADIDLGRGGEALRDGRRGRLAPGSVWDWVEASQSYAMARVVEAFEGYWVHLAPGSGPVTVRIVGVPAEEPATLGKNWSLTGVFDPVDALHPGMSSSVWYWFNGQYWKATAESIIPGFAYWFFTLEDETPIRQQR